MARGPAFHNNEPAATLPSGAPPDILRAEFGRRLNHLMVLKGWNQSDLARAAQEVATPLGVRVTPDKISKYIRGRVLPLPAVLRVLADTLGCKTRELLPEADVSEVGGAIPRTFLQQASDGTTWLRVNQQVTMQTALKVLSLLNERED